VPEDADKIPAADGSDKTFIVSAIRIGCLALLVYWSWLLLQPFLSIIVWSVIFAVALYPVFDWLAGRLGGYRGVAAAAITIFSLILIFGPVTWLGVSLGDNLRTLYARLADSFARGRRFLPFGLHRQYGNRDAVLCAFQCQR